MPPFDPVIPSESLATAAHPPVVPSSWSGHRSDAQLLAAAGGVRTVGVVGAGLMGVAIAAANARRNLKVFITDANDDAQAAACGRIEAELAQYVGAGGEVVPTARQRVVSVADPGGLAACDLILETVTENLAAKQAIYAQLERHLGPRSLLASNTSTIPIARLAVGLADPGRFCGLHFFHPVRQRPLVEIVRGPRTSNATIDAATAYVQAIAKMPIVVDDGPGFLVNRLLVPYLNEALEILLDGATIEQVEQAAASFGMALGPLRMLDEIGLETVLLAGRVLWEAFPDRVIASPLLVTMYKSGRRGCKAGAGFFRYLSDWSGTLLAQPDPQVEAIVAKWARKPQPMNEEQITARLLLPMVLEATRLLEEGKVKDASTIDTAMVHGLGFPARRGGLLRWADTLGADRILQRLRSLEPLGLRAEPTGLLREMARQGRSFYAGVNRRSAMIS